MQRYFVKKDNVVPPEVWIDGDDARHIQKVMRMSPGDECICAVSDEEVYHCEIKTFELQKVLLKIIATVKNSSELPVRITIAQGLPKSDKFEWIVQKGTETGARAFLPFQAKRSVVKWTGDKWSKKADRFKKIAKEAAEQSHRTKVPDILDIHMLKDLIAYSKSFDHKIVAYEETGKGNDQSGLPLQFNKMAQGENVLVVIGPEGGLTPEEVHTFMSSGFICCGLGPRILRTETAALYILSAASYHFELLNGVN